jgi:hypothetical protein
VFSDPNDNLNILIAQNKDSEQNVLFDIQVNDLPRPHLDYSLMGLLLDVVTVTVSDIDIVREDVPPPKKKRRT